MSRTPPCRLTIAAMLVGVCCQALAADIVVKVGFSSPLTGAQAAAGKDNERGLRMAIDELNQNGIKVGADTVRFEAMVEDDQADPKAGVAVAQKLVDAKVKAVFGPYNSGVAIPASKLYNDAGIVMATVGSNPKITLQGFSNVFRVSASDSQLGGKMALYAAKELKFKRVSLIDDRTAYGVGVVEEFTKVAKANGIEIVSRDFTNDKASDFNSILTNIKSKNPDAVFYGGYFSQAAPMKRQMKSLGLNIPLLGGDAICDAELGSLGGDAVNGSVYCTQGGGLLKTNSAETFVANFEKRNNAKPMFYAVSFYDAMKLVADSMSKAGSVEPAKYGPIMAQAAYKGVAGTYEFDANHDLKSSPVTIFLFKNGRPEPLANY
ncbi:ABC-type branched-subunit amino acid transport system substrate-binding protein [Herbaspirillum sp. Sphag1AN]|uniref:branched-chain amino acid ABC transporter substrate-binding protein n=1 Tax=unclassified Herbaspirillum TaxID=2624150 RepID=UPI001614F285|nr:ABC-type branched-subunit amino acid transport system substrate-binding protein [Herbaspirillum sp. Sphag1AN]MBB3247324.1 ABC-type branched-subunit amino acid transport system substrate-binding protein [Herbaspirillum sp. Sphag64]